MHLSNNKFKVTYIYPCNFFGNRFIQGRPSFSFEGGKMKGFKGLRGMGGSNLIYILKTLMGA